MILVVEDYVDTGRALRGLLRHMGCPAECVNNGVEALAYIRNHPPELPLLVVLDEMMPGMTGLEVLRQMRLDPKIAHHAVIIYTAGFDLAKRDEAIALGALA